MHPHTRDSVERKPVRGTQPSHDTTWEAVLRFRRGNRSTSRPVWTRLRLLGERVPALGFFALFAFLFVLWRREKRRGGLLDESAPSKLPTSPTTDSASTERRHLAPGEPKQVEA